MLNCYDSSVWLTIVSFYHYATIVKLMTFNIYDYRSLFLTEFTEFDNITPFQNSATKPCDEE
jgi:hypothetical protein